MGLDKLSLSGAKGTPQAQIPLRLNLSKSARNA